MSKHTPGPWALRKEWSDSEAALEVWPSGEVCKAPYKPSAICLVDECRDAAEANAQLIAAAPEMLAALKWAARFINTEAHDPQLMETVDAAIAKAEGRAE